MHSLTLDHGCAYELCGGVFGQRCGDGDQGMKFVRLPSVISGTTTEAWSHPDIGFRSIDFAMDPSQDVLILVEDPISLLAMRTSQAHKHITT
jgi:hypothetical protein